MKLSPESSGSARPSSLTIIPSDRDIGPKLDLVCRIDPCARGGITELMVDQSPVEPGTPTGNLIGTGYEEIHGVDDGLCIHFMDSTIARDWRLTARNVDNCLRLRIPFAGSADFEGAEGRVSDQGSRCTFIVQPADSRLTGVYRAGDTYRFCAINISEAFLRQRLGLSDNALPRALQSSWANHENALGNIELSRPALANAARLFSLASQGDWRRIEVHSIALELLRQIMEAWMDTAANARTQVRLRPSERDALMRLRQFVDERCPVPISMPEAVRFTGLNKNKIHAGFHQFFGMSLREYCLDSRMQKARDALLGGQLSVAAVADLVGFSEPTNFTNSFRQHFGMLPSEFRRVRS